MNNITNVSDPLRKIYTKDIQSDLYVVAQATGKIRSYSAVKRRIQARNYQLSRQTASFCKISSPCEVLIDYRDQVSYV